MRQPPTSFTPEHPLHGGYSDKKESEARIRYADNEGFQTTWTQDGLKSKPTHYLAANLLSVTQSPANVRRTPY
jgi:hypothetical protein